MASVSISELDAGANVQSTDLFPDVQVPGVGPVKVTAAQIKTFMSDNPTFVNPNIGISHGTSLALGGAIIGSNSLAVTGSSNLSSVSAINLALCRATRWWRSWDRYTCWIIW